MRRNPLPEFCTLLRLPPRESARNICKFFIPNTLLQLLLVSIRFRFSSSSFSPHVLFDFVHTSAFILGSHLLHFLATSNLPAPTSGMSFPNPLFWCTVDPPSTQGPPPPVSCDLVASTHMQSGQPPALFPFRVSTPLPSPPTPPPPHPAPALTTNCCVICNHHSPWRFLSNLVSQHVSHLVPHTSDNRLPLPIPISGRYQHATDDTRFHYFLLLVTWSVRKAASGDITQRIMGSNSCMGFFNIATCSVGV